jgi:uncharacterized protein YcfJ
MLTNTNRLLTKTQFAICCAVILFLTSFANTRGDNEASGMIIGGIIGGVLGHELGEGHGRTDAKVISTLIGTSIGGNVGRSMDEMDRVKVSHSL